MKCKKVALLVPILCMLFSCGNKTDVEDKRFTVHFDTCTDLETNVVPDQKLEEGSLIDEPSVFTPMDSRLNIKITGWYQEKKYINKWDFLNDTVTKSMTLYARWAETITINYYLKGSSTPIWTVDNAAKGEPLELHDELCDGYKFFGYYEDSACTVPFDLNKPLEDTTTVYLYRGETLTYNASSIKRRFAMFASSGSGSKQGNISAVQTDSEGVSYVDVNFGYSTTADPFMRTSNPQIDISKSQKIGLKFKNFGDASSIAFYWISRYANGSYASGIMYEAEDNSVHVQLSDNEKNMTEDDPWVEKVIDLSAKTTSGVSSWGNSVTMVSLRIQFAYVSKNERDLSNVVRFAEIYGISDDTHVGFKDSDAIKNILHNDSEEEINAAKAGQTQNRGVIFPLDEACVTSDSSTTFMKKDGILIYSSYDTDINRFIFDVSNQNIDASDYSYLTIKMKNYSYVTSLMVSVITISPTTGRETSNNATITLSARMDDKEEFSVNLYGRNNMVGIVSKIRLNFNVNGVDNAMLIESITLDANRPFQIPGINFDDLNSAGFVSNSHVNVSYNKIYKATKFDVQSNGQISNHLSYDFDLIAYKDISLSYYYTQTGITSVKVILTYSNGSSGEYLFNNFSTNADLRTITLPLNEEGTLTDVALEFTGVGSIYITQIKFSIDYESSCDLSSSLVFNSFLPDWSKSLSYVSDKEATLYNSKTDFARYYFGFLYKSGRREAPNISLKGKTKVYVIYQNQKPTCGFYLNVYVVDKRTSSDYLTDINESSPIIREQAFPLTMNMDNLSWKVASIDIPAQYANNENYYISNIAFGVRSSDTTIYLRGVVFK